MTRREPPEEDETLIDMTPMLDIVFIMLIFFIVTATFVKQSGVDVARPAAVTAVPQERVALVVAVTAENAIWINGREVDRRAVRAVVEQLHAENPQGSLVIQADEAAQSGLVVEIMEQVRLAGVPAVALAATQGE